MVQEAAKNESTVKKPAPDKTNQRAYSGKESKYKPKALKSVKGQNRRKNDSKKSLPKRKTKRSNDVKRISESKPEPAPASKPTHEMTVATSLTRTSTGTSRESYVKSPTLKRKSSTKKIIERQPSDMLRSHDQLENIAESNYPTDFSEIDAFKIGMTTEEKAFQMSSLVSEKSSCSRSDRKSVSVQEESVSFSIRPSIIDRYEMNCTCMLCCTTFDNALQLQSHLVIQRHLPRESLKHEEHFLYPLFDCIACNTSRTNRYHPCLKSLEGDLNIFIKSNTRDGSPLTCTLCEGKVFKSIHHLIIHIVTYHGFRNRAFNQQYLNCPLCHSLFRTRNTFTIECHALAEHLPELVVTKQKLMHPEGKPHQLLMRHFACYFENTKYNTGIKKSYLDNCTASFADLSSLIGHLCYAHYPLPSNFQGKRNRPITCNACLFRFTNRTDLRDHVLCAHNSFMRFRALGLSVSMSFQDHCDSRIVCQFCWTNQGSIARLQTHILVYHLDSWRRCGYCQREFCEANKLVSPVIIYLTMERHVDHHLLQLQAHFTEMVDICQLRKPPCKIIEYPDPKDNFFASVKISDHKVTEEDCVTPIMSKLRQFARSPSFDLSEFS